VSMRRVSGPVLALLLVATAAAGCGEPQEKPSAAALMICQEEVVEEIAGALGGAPVREPEGSWADHRYGCPYVWPDGTMTLAVQELADRPAAGEWFEARRAGGGVPVDGLGEAAFARPDGSVVVRKDSTVLTVDVGGLPGTFGRPPRSRADVALTVATTVLTCWKEHG